MNRFIKIGKASEILGFSIQTLRRWEKLGKIEPEPHKKVETRYYDMKKLFGLKKAENNKTIAYARVSSHDQKEDLVGQAVLLSRYCTMHGWEHEVIQDLGSGMNYYKKGLKRLLDMILEPVLKP